MTPATEERREGNASREFRFSAEHFRVISERIYSFSGIRLPEAKREMVYARLARRLRALGIGSFDDYVRFLELEPAEWEHCTNALTTNVTAFYREEHHFTILAEHARARQADEGTYRVWSAGCSTGEEPYTIAMCLADALPLPRLRGARHRPGHAGARACARRRLPARLGREARARAPEALLPARRRAATRGARACAGRSPRTWSSCA